MIDVLQFLVEHGYTVLFVGVLAEQIGLPFPAQALLLAAGALAGAQQLDLSLAVALASLAAVLADLFWYELGRRRGSKVLRFLCRISLEPDSCVRQTEEMFARHGARSLLIAKFIPGLSTVAPPLAGIFRMRLPRFLLFDLLGAVLWAGTFTGLGLVFSDQLERLAGAALKLGTWLIVALLAGLAAYIAWKYVQRRRFIRQLRIDRITPDELKQKLDAGEEVVVVDLRHSIDFEGEPMTIPGALQLSPDQLEQRAHEIPRERDIILYCT